MAATPVESCRFVDLRSPAGSPRVGTIHVQAPTPHAPSLQSFLVDFSQRYVALGQKAKVCFQTALREH